MKDTNGRQLYPGDFICYAVRGSTSCWLNFARIVEFSERKVYYWRDDVLPVAKAVKATSNYNNTQFGTCRVTLAMPDVILRITEDQLPPWARPLLEAVAINQMQLAAMLDAEKEVANV